MKDFYFYAEGLSVGYNGEPVIRDIEIGINRGEILTLIGPNGAGKTTVLKSILNQLELISGTVYLENLEIPKLPRKELAKKMSVVFTKKMMTELMTCRDVVATGRYPYTGHFGILSEKDWEIVKEAMKIVHILDLADKDFKKISDGQKQRVMLARALCQEPEIILLDEPTSFLDIKYKLEFLSMIQKMSREKNLSVIMSLHELELAERVSDKVLCLKGDKVDRFGSPEEVFSDGYITKLYDINTGSYDERSGNVELAHIKQTPKIFVIAGNGMATPVYRSLQREGISFATGIIWENDIDYPCAKELASIMIEVEAFSTPKPEVIEECKNLIDNCESAICPKKLTELLKANEALTAIYKYAFDKGKLRLY